MDEIAELEEKLKNFVVQKCEVWSRVCGYYQSVKNFNPGKKEEFSKRAMFNIGDNITGGNYGVQE